MARIKLNVDERKELGTTDVRRKIRSQGHVPGIVYGRGKKNIAVKVSKKTLHDIKGGHVAENVLLDLVIKGGSASDKKKTVLVKEIQKDPINGDWLHIDFNEISMTEKIKATIIVEVIGEAKGIAEGGILEQIMHELEIECLPVDLPEHIKVDVTELAIGHTLYVKDLKVPDKVVVLSDPEAPVVAVVVPRAEEVEAAPEGEGEGEEAAEPEVIKKGKKEEEEVSEEGEKPEKKQKEESKGKEKENK